MIFFIALTPLVEDVFAALHFAPVGTSFNEAAAFNQPGFAQCFAYFVCPGIRRNVSGRPCKKSPIFNKAGVEGNSAGA
jgi:hypothetical protein